MPKSRKMLGDIHSKECNSLMKLIETQSKTTLALWAINYVTQHYLPIYEDAFPKDKTLTKTIQACKSYLSGNIKRSELKPYLKQATQIARDITDQPILQAAARAIATACATTQTPTNALGFVFYGAAISAYQLAGFDQTPDVYDALAKKEFQRALDSLKEIAVDHEDHPANIKWNC